MKRLSVRNEGGGGREGGMRMKEGIKDEDGGRGRIKLREGREEEES